MDKEREPTGVNPEVPEVHGYPKVRKICGQYECLFDEDSAPVVYIDGDWTLYQMLKECS